MKLKLRDWNHFHLLIVFIPNTRYSMAVSLFMIFPFPIPFHFLLFILLLIFLLFSISFSLSLSLSLSLSFSFHFFLVILRLQSEEEEAEEECWRDSRNVPEVKATADEKEYLWGPWVRVSQFKSSLLYVRPVHKLLYWF